jgi:hypothetical protein
MFLGPIALLVLTVMSKKAEAGSLSLTNSAGT